MDFETESRGFDGMYTLSIRLVGMLRCRHRQRLRFSFPHRFEADDTARQTKPVLIVSGALHPGRLDAIVLVVLDSAAHLRMDASIVGKYYFPHVI
jgi:hypothetical protein